MSMEHHYAGERIPLFEGYGVLQRYVHKTGKWRIKCEDGTIAKLEERQIDFLIESENEKDTISMKKESVSTPDCVPKESVTIAEKAMEVESKSLESLDAVTDGSIVEVKKVESKKQTIEPTKKIPAKEKTVPEAADGAGPKKEKAEKKTTKKEKVVKKEKKSMFGQITSWFR